MKFFLNLFIFTSIFLSQEKKIETEVYIGSNIRKSSIFITKNLFIGKNSQMEIVCFANNDTIYLIDHQKKELKRMDAKSTLATLATQMGTLGNLLIHKTDKKKKVKGFETTIYKIRSKKGSPFPVRGKMYIGYFKEFADPKFKTINNFLKQANPVLKQLENGDYPLKLFMSIDTRQEQPFDINQKVITIKDKLSKEDKKYIDKILSYKKLKNKN